MGSSNAYTSGVPPFAPGDQLSASSLEKMREADQRGLPQRSLGTYVRQTPSGTMVTPWRQPRRGTGTHPFKLIDATDKEGVKVQVVYGAVIDMMDWQEPKVIAPKIGQDENVPDSEGRRPKLDLPQSEEIDVFVVIHQGEHGRVNDSEDKAPEIVAHPADSMPEIENGTLYVHVARIKTVENEAEGEDEPSRRIDRIDQILGSHIVWPFKPDFVGWQQRNDEDESKAALWLGAGSEYIDDCDKLEDLHVRVQREEFDNGRDGDTVFELLMPEDSDKQSVLAFDKNQERGVELRMSEGNDPATRLTVDRKSTVGGGLRVVSDSEGCSVGIVSVDEGGQLSLACKKEDDEVEARIEFDSENKAVIDMRAVEEKVIKFTEPEFDNGRDGDTQFMVRAPDGAAAVTLSIDKNQERGFEAGAGESSSWISLDRKTTVSPGFRASSNDTEAGTVLTGPNEGASVRANAKEEESKISVEAEDASGEIKAEANKITQRFEAGEMEIVCRKEGFDNGRDGDSMFRARTSDSGSASLTLDKNQERGFEAGCNDSSSWLRLDRKNTVGGGFGASSNASEASAAVSGPNEGGSARLLARETEARFSAEAENASVEAKADQEAKITLDSPSPEVSLSGSIGSTRVTTVDGKQISMREISFMSSDGKTPMKAWFLASEPEAEETDSNDHEGHHAEHHDGEGHQGHHAEHHTEHGTHHMGHYVDPDHDPDDSGLGHGSHHAGHHEGHHAEHHDDDEPHHSSHHNQGGA